MRLHALSGRRTILAAALATLLVASTLTAPSLTAAAPSDTDARSTDNLDPALLAEMRRQNMLEPAVHGIWDEHLKTPQSGFAGVAFEGKGLSVYWKGELTPGMSAAIARAREWGTVTVKPAAYSDAELQAAGRKIMAASLRHSDHDIQSIGFEPDGSGLEVARGPQTVHPDSVGTSRATGPLTPAAQILQEAAVEVPVTVVDGSEPMELMVSRSDDSPPWNGGGQWESRRGLELRGKCTTRFGVRASGRTFVLSAGHCGTPPDYAYQGSFGQSGFAEMGPVHSDDWRSDLLLIDASGWYKIFDGSANTTTTKVVNSWGYWSANQLACQSGRTSGTVCGLKQIRSENFHVNCSKPDSDGDCNYWIEGVIRADQVDGATAARGGDSGGPVFTLNGSGVRAKGITVGGTGSSMWFQDWADVIRVFGAYPRTG
ncbi:hypothetical protein HCB18_09345 [Salinispora arenicola]|nr:hypothetical protein [Salinispora arenicola]